MSVPQAAILILDTILKPEMKIFALIAIGEDHVCSVKLDSLWSLTIEVDGRRIGGKLRRGTIGSCQVDKIGLIADRNRSCSKYSGPPSSYSHIVSYPSWDLLDLVRSPHNADNR
jgi:hypothetical protein